MRALSQPMLIEKKTKQILILSVANLLRPSFLRTEELIPPLILKIINKKLIFHVLVPPVDIS